MKIIAHIKTDFPTKFGLPRQSGLVEEIKGKIVFEEEYRVPEAFRGLEGFSHIWLLWQFSEAVRDNWSPTVRPPLLGGNTRMGVFATRSPFRPNPIGLSCVKLEKIDFNCSDGPVLFVSGCDLMDGTPIYDIKPYLPYADSIPDAAGGFTQTLADRTLEVEFDSLLLDRIPADKRETLIQVLSGDPRPSYQNDPERVYGFVFAGFEVKFTVSDRKLTVTEVIPEK
ncbi:MAG: tRNA (N6-threonylcarbamoyladenosine(37)-N6)-methyltransferase TrmO [Clostridia bacterium]|nr:tRNA (N6-threonylcarbamoyladenosine(37)-N6)-methyltransferase TrmO [Clostridia bacterium]